MGELNSEKDFLKFMNEHYFVSKFEQFERDNCWDELYWKINVWSDEQEKNLNLTYDVSNCFDNMEKNRYRNVLPYDQNRITLKETGEVKTDYINASPLHMPATKQDYILTQGPLATTADDFWQMVYEQKSEIVIMLSKIMEKNFIKCHSYFPSSEEPLSKFDLFECELLNEEAKQHYICRQIRLSPLLQDDSTHVSTSQDPITADSTASSQPPTQDKSRVIQHFQFTTWPDFGVPEHTDHFLEFLQHVRSTNQRLSEDPAPMVCHCSAGIGRTGTFVIVDSIISVLEQQRRMAGPPNESNSETQQQPSSGVSEPMVEPQEPQEMAPTMAVVENEAASSTSNNCCPQGGEALEKGSESLPCTQQGIVLDISDLAENSTPKDIAKVKRKKIKQRGDPSLLEQRQSSRQLEPLDELSDLVVFIRKSRMGLIQTPSQLRFCWKAIVDWIQKECDKQQIQKESDDASSGVSEKKKSRSEPSSSSESSIAHPVAASSPSQTNNGKANLEFRREKVQRMVEKMREAEKRRHAAFFSRLLFSLVDRAGGVKSALSTKSALIYGSAGVVAIFSLMYCCYFYYYAKGGGGGANGSGTSGPASSEL